MSGQPTPTTLLEAFAIDAPDSTQSSPTAGGRTNPFPTGSSSVAGGASLHDGFPAQTMTDPTAGGTPPLGVDMNGILYLLSQHIAALNAGQLYVWQSTLEAAMSGYALGAVLQQASDPTAFWINMTAGNSNDPDTASPPGSTGWMSTKPLRQSTAPTAGTHNDVALLGASDYVYDVDCTAGAITLTGFVPQRDGQRLVARKIDSSGNALNLSSLTGSAAGHQLQIVTAGISLSQQYMAVTLIFNSSVNAWVQT